MLWNVMRAELLKLKRTLALWVVILAPVVITLLLLLVLLRRKEPMPAGTLPWHFLEQNVTAIWAMLMLPLVLALQAALLDHVETAGNNWKHLGALPVPRWSLYFAKLAANVLLAAMATAILVVAIVAAGLTAWILRPDLHFTLGMPTPSLWLPPLAAFVAAGQILVIQSWVSMRFAGLVPGLMVGIAGAVANTIIVSSRYAKEFPWSFPILANLNTQKFLSGEAAHFSEPSQLITFLIIITALAALTAVLAVWGLSRRDIV